MTRRTIALAGACALAAAFGGAGTAQAAGGCQLDGTASFAQPLGQDAKPFEYSFVGTLSNCRSDTPGDPMSGAISSNVPITENGVTYEPDYSDTGNGSCASSTTAGTAVVTWADRTVSVIRYTTTGAAAVVGLQGSVVPSATYTGTDPNSGLPVTKTFTTTRYLGRTSTGLLAFQADPTQCAGSGVAAAGISGVVTIR